MDKQCAKRHLEAVKDSVVTHKELHSYLFMKGEHADDVLDLAGLENAPGVYAEVTQSCRLVFTNQKRLVFTQVNACVPFRPPGMMRWRIRACSLRIAWTRRREKLLREEF